MSPFASSLARRWTAYEAGFRRNAVSVALIVALNLVALGLMAWSETDLVSKSVFLLTWGLANFFWLILLRRPVVSAALSLGLILTMILLSRLKYDIVWMTANFLDVWIINADTISFILAVMPGLYRGLIIAFALIVPVLGLLWWFDALRVRLRFALPGFLACLAGLTGVSLAFPQEEWVAFFPDAYVSKF